MIRMIQRTPESQLAEIAMATGFADQSPFPDAFNRQTGFSPSAYRRWVHAS